MSLSRTPAESRFPVKRALAYFALAYILVNILATAVSVTYSVIANAAQPAPGTSLFKAPAFEATVPYHVLIMVIVWPAFAWRYFRRRAIADRESMRKETIRLSFLWLVSALVTDFVLFVVPDFFVPYTYSFTPYDFYIDYQPWISLIYAAIYAGPWIHFALSRRSRTPANSKVAHIT